MTRSNVQRLAALALGAVSILALSATTANAAPTVKPKAPTAIAPVVDSNCQPASAMTPEQRAKLPSFRICARSARAGAGLIAPGLIQPNVYKEYNGNINKTTSVASWNVNFQFRSKYEVEMNGAALRDVACDGRSVFADLNDNNGFQAEYRNSLGCNHTATYADAYFYDNDYMKWIYFRIHACNIATCSSPTNTGDRFSAYW